MRLPEFSYACVQTILEACKNLEASDSLPCAGGTDLLVNLKHRLIAPSQLVDLKRIPGLNVIRLLPDGCIGIGALATISAIERSEVIRQRVPFLAAAAQSVATPQIRNKATVGGNICLETRCWFFNMPVFSRQARPACNKQGGSCCHVVPAENQARCYSLFSADTVPPLISVNSKVKLSSAQGDRVLPLSELYSGDGARPLAMNRGEIVTEVLIPPLAPRTYSCYLKFRERGALDFPVVGVAASLCFEADNATCRKAKIVLTGIAPGPVEASGAEAYLENKPFTPETIAEASNLVRDAAAVYSLNGIPANYKRAIIKEYVSRALSQIQQESAGGDGWQ